MLFVVVCWLFSKVTFSKNSFRNTIGVSNSLGPDQVRHSVGHDLGPNCVQRLSADDTSSQRVSLLVLPTDNFANSLGLDQTRVAWRERFIVALRSAFLTSNDDVSKKRYFVTVRCTTKTFLFKICIHINRFVPLCLCNGLFHISLSARLLKNSFVELRSAIL